LRSAATIEPERLASDGNSGFVRDARCALHVTTLDESVELSRRVAGNHPHCGDPAPQVLPQVSAGPLPPFAKRVQDHSEDQGAGLRGEPLPISPADSHSRGLAMWAETFGVTGVAVVIAEGQARCDFSQVALPN
jgi:hypothetical protein